MLRADLMLKVQTIAAAGPTSETTEYYKGNLMRRDFGPGYQVVDFSTGRSFSVNPQRTFAARSGRALAEGAVTSSTPAYEARPLSWSDQLVLEWLHFRAWLDLVFSYPAPTVS